MQKLINGQCYCPTPQVYEEKCLSCGGKNPIINTKKKRKKMEDKLV